MADSQDGDPAHCALLLEDNEGQLSSALGEAAAPSGLLEWLLHWHLNRCHKAWHGSPGLVPTTAASFKLHIYSATEP